MGLITAWSFSRWSVYEECPAKAKFKFVDKLQEPGSASMDRGTMIHKKIETYLSSAGGTVPNEVKPMAAELRALKKLKPVVEGERAFNVKWEPCDWFARDTWCRVKVDALVPPVTDNGAVARVVDFKSGQLKTAGEYDDQLELYGLAGLLLYATAEKSTGELWFVDHGRIVQRAEGEFSRKDEKKLKKKWEIRVKPMLSDTVFKPRPGNYCRWCHFRKANDGPCMY